MFRTKKAAEPDDRIPPLVVRKGREADEDGWGKTADELAPVIEIMERLGLTEAGFTVTDPRGLDIHADGPISDRAALDKLLEAREAIRGAARQAGILCGLPEPYVCLRGKVIDLFGYGEPGEPWAYQYYGRDYRAGHVSLVPVRLASAIVTAAPAR
jgi:hypothetical protein